MLLKSDIDNSVNFVKNKDNGYFEARYVRRNNDYFIAYISSQNGCKQACRFCHLTASKQTMDEMATTEDILTQAREVLDYHSHQDIKPPLVHFNFMARGEPLVNPYILNNFDEIYNGLKSLSEEYGLAFKIKISTIIPESVTDLGFLNKPHVDVYYSLYSLKDSFRKRWIPKGLNPEKTGKLLQKIDSLILHHTYIKGENDNLTDVYDILSWLERYNLNANLNIVRYNPFDDKRGCESDESVIHNLVSEMSKSSYIKKHKIVQRVGFDVFASCGMFIV